MVQVILQAPKACLSDLSRSQITPDLAQGQSMTRFELGIDKAGFPYQGGGGPKAFNLVGVNIIPRCKPLISLGYWTCRGDCQSIEHILNRCFDIFYFVFYMSERGLAIIRIDVLLFGYRVVPERLKSLQ